MLSHVNLQRGTEEGGAAMSRSSGATRVHMSIPWDDAWARSVERCG